MRTMKQNKKRVCYMYELTDNVFPFTLSLWLLILGQHSVMNYKCILCVT